MRRMEEYTLVRARRKTLSLQVTRELKVVVRAPRWVSKREIEAFVEGRADWIRQHRERQAQRNAADTVSPKEEAALLSLAKELLPRRTEMFGNRLGLTASSVRITGARTRFGSCNGPARLCFSWRLLRYPLAAIDYVVVHELCHIPHKNHGAAFYREIEKILPDYREREQLLRQLPLPAGEAIEAAQELLQKEETV